MTSVDLMNLFRNMEFHVGDTLQLPPDLVGNLRCGHQGLVVVRKVDRGHTNRHPSIWVACATKGCVHTKTIIANIERNHYWAE